MSAPERDRIGLGLQPCDVCNRLTLHRTYANAFDDVGTPVCNHCYDGSAE